MKQEPNYMPAGAPRTIKSLRVKEIEKDDFFLLGITRKKYYKTIRNNYMGLRVWLVDDHGVPFPGRPKTFFDRKFVKKFTPQRTKLRCN